MKVAASSLRKGNALDIDGKLYIVLSIENIHPGKGTPVTQLDMRRISDGVKVSERYRTTEVVERAEVDERNHTFLYSDGDGYHFMNPESYDQLPPRVTLEVVETEPVVKGQTASGSYKPAILSNGVRTMVPTYITAGTRIVVMTEDGSYSERAKD